MAAPRILTLRHMPGERDDRVSSWLRRHDYELLATNPAHGVPLPTEDDDCEALVIYGGVQSVNDDSLEYMNDERRLIERWLKDDRPILGICLGGQMIAQVLGAPVQRHAAGREEIGYVPIESLDSQFMTDSLNIYQWHNEGFDIPAAATRLARGRVFDNQAFSYGSNTYGFQFHPEVTPALVEIWNSEVKYDMKDVTGADPVAKQIADAKRYNADVENWTHRFLQHWTDGFASASGA